VLKYDSHVPDKPQLGQLIADFLMANLSATEGLNIVDRSDIDAAIGELKLNLTGVVTVKDTVKIGNFLGADIMLTGNIFTVDNPRIMVINISTFLTHIPFGSEEYYNYDLREPKRKIINPDKIRETRKTVVTTNDWSNIPHYPTTREKRENVVKYLMSMGKPVPQDLLRQIASDKQKEVEQDSFNNFNNSNKEEPPAPPTQEQIYRAQVQQHILRQQQQQIRQQQQPPPNKYSPQYASYIGAKPRAQASVKIGMGTRR